MGFYLTDDINRGQQCDHSHLLKVILPAPPCHGLTPYEDRWYGVCLVNPHNNAAKKKSLLWCFFDADIGKKAIHEDQSRFLWSKNISFNTNTFKLPSAKSQVLGRQSKSLDNWAALSYRQKTKITSRGYLKTENYIRYLYLFMTISAL